MMGDTWSLEPFSCELAGTLERDLSGGGETSLRTAIGACAEAAEHLCRQRPMACAAGCPHCCVLNVAVLLPEALVIADWLRERFAPPEFEPILKRLSLHRAWYRWMDDEERVAKHVVCPMLGVTGDCLIHPVRPLVCHGVTSLDSNSCREALAPGITDEARLVLTDLVRRAAFDAAFGTLATALKKHGFDDRSIDLGVGVMGFLEHPEYRGQLLAGGKLPGELWR